VMEFETAVIEQPRGSGLLLAQGRHSNRSRAGKAVLCDRRLAF